MTSVKLEAQRAKVLEVARKASAEGLMRLTMGNFSVRDPETGLVAITPSGRPYDDMTPADICVVTLDDDQVDGPYKPSFETPIHTYVYRTRRKVNGVVHTHSPYCNIFGLLGIDIPPVLVTQLAYVGGMVRVAPYQKSGRVEFAESALEVMGDGNVVVLANHGILAVGADIDSAFARAIYTEEGAMIYFNALRLGDNPHTLTDYVGQEGPEG
jgi:L-fuculose-phosphate aldolase